jgi:hypothetical protein
MSHDGCTSSACEIRSITVRSPSDSFAAESQEATFLRRLRSSVGNLHEELAVCIQVVRRARREIDFNREFLMIDCF